MHARVVRFTDVSAEQIENVRKQVEESDGPPEGVKTAGMKLIHDADQSTAVFVGFFASEQDMKDADAVFDKMDSSETPGTRASVDRGEVVIERDD